MSHSAFLQSLPPGLRQITQQPYWWPAVASIGLHGLFFAVLPFLPSTFSRAEEPDIRRTVPLVELTPEEAQRIPELSGSDLELPPIPDEDLYTFNDDFGAANPDVNLDPLYPLPDTSSSFPLIPYFPPPPLFNIPLPSQRPVPAPNSQQPPRPQASPQPQPSQSPSPTPEPSPEEFARRPSADVTELENLAPMDTGDRPARSPNATQPQQPSLLAEQQRLRELFAYNPSGTTQEDANAAFGDWFYEKMGGEDLDDLPTEELTADYPRSACPIQRDVAAVYGVVVDAANKVVADQTELLQSSGYAFFNQKALEAINTHSFNNESGQNQPYFVTVRFDYQAENCPSAPAPASPGSGDSASSGAPATPAPSSNPNS